MAADRANLASDDYSTEMVAVLLSDVARDIHLAVRFLGHMGVRGTPEKLLRLPPKFSLQLGAAMRLLLWESQGFYLHREAGLPSADEAILNALLSFTTPEFWSADFCRAVLQLSLARFAWHGPLELAADVALDELPDDALDMLAEHLWASRHANCVTETSLP